MWTAIIGVLGTLGAALGTQWFTNRREFSRDQLKWAQERQQRVLDAQTAAFSEALSALHPQVLEKLIVF